MNRRTRKGILRDANLGSSNVSIYIPPQIKPMKKEFTTGRNSLCPCGSNIKYKNCCLNTNIYENYN